MRALVVYCHPRRGSFTEAVRDVRCWKSSACTVRRCGCATFMREGFDPVLSAA
jgi:putative NADPH-quinone reductase